MSADELRKVWARFKVTQEQVRPMADGLGGYGPELGAEERRATGAGTAVVG